MKEEILFKQLLKSASEYIYFKDTESRFTSISTSLATRFGLKDPKEAIGKKDGDFFEEEHAREAVEDEQRILKTGKPILDKVESENLKGKSEKEWVSTSKFPLLDEDGRIVGTYGISKDITNQIRAEKLLRDNDEKFKKLTELTPGFLFVYEFGIDQRVRFPFASEGIRELFALEPEDIRDNFTPLVERVHPEDTEKVQQSILESIQNLTDWDCEYRIFHPEKGLKWVKGKAHPEKQKDGTILSPGYITDITKQKKIEERLSYNDGLFSKLSQLAPGFLFLHEVDEKRNIRFPFVSEGIREMFDLAPEDIKESINPLMRRVHKDDLKMVMGSIMESVKFVSDWDCEYRIWHPEKGLRWVKGRATPELQKDGKVLSPGYITDITETRKIAEDNAKLKTQFQAVFNTNPNLIFVKDEGGKYTMVNDAACTFFNKRREDVIGKTDFDLGIPEDRAKEYLDADRKVLETQKPLFFPEIKTELEDGEVLWHQTIKVPFQQKESDQKAVLSIVTDITERKAREQELNETLNIISEQNQRLTNFAHIVSHNLRNHAGNISMLLKLYDPEESEEEKAEMLEFLRQASDNLNESIADLNEIVDQQQKTITQRKLVNLKKYVAKTKEILTTEILANNVQFIEEIPEDLCFEYNPAYMESIILNMFSNAIKYRNPKASLIIRAKGYEEEGHIFFEISDNGQGIDLEKHGNKLFGMYNTFHGNENAKGIGLFITKNQIEAMGGRIDVDSEIGKGTTFKIRLK